MAITRLSLTATPGRRYNFSAKGGGGPHTGNFTELSVLGVPGRQHSFSPKSEAVVPHAGQFTYLAVYATPGPRHTFTAKTLAPETDEAVTGAGDDRRLAAQRRLRELQIQLLREDEEVIAILTAAAATGIFK